MLVVVAYTGGRKNAGELSEKATLYQASIDDKDGSKKLYDATDEVFYQVQKLYPNLPLDRATVRNIVQHEYEKLSTDSKKGA